MPLLFSGLSRQACHRNLRFVRLAVISMAAASTVLMSVHVSARTGGLPGLQDAQVEQNDRIAASFVLARGRLPAAAELAAWPDTARASFADLLARHREQVRQDSAAQQAVAAKASLDAFGVQPGRSPTGSEAAAGIYLDIMRQHLQWLTARLDEYAKVVQRAYRLVLRRDAYAPELEYWARRPVQSFALVAACIDDWARRNQPGLTVTSGPAAVNVNSPYLAAVRLSPADAAQARAVAGFARPRGSAAALGRHLVAPGAEEVASVGGIHFAAAGAPGLRGE
jgi:hypothetical protein